MHNHHLFCIYSSVESLLCFKFDYLDSKQLNKNGQNIEVKLKRDTPL